LAISAKFIADFSSFNEAVQKAEVVLRGFETGAGKVSSSLSRMTDTFSGRKITTEATLMAEAVERVGGISKLTAKELERIGTTAQEAAAKLRALGKDVPAGIQKIADASKNAATSASTFAGSLKNVNTLLGAFGVSLSIGALVQFGRSLLQTADDLVRVADRTGLTTTEVQKLQYIAGQSGNSLDELTSAVGRLQVNLVSGDKGAAGAVKVLGLNFKELRDSSPFDQMEQIATAIAKVPDPTARAALAMELFGRQGAAILPTLIADFKKLGDEAPKMSDKTVRALEQAGDAFAWFGQTVKVWAAESFSFAGRMFDQLALQGMKFRAMVLNMTADLLEMAQKIPGVAKAMGVLGVSTESLRKSAQFYTDMAGAQAAALNRVDVEVRKVVPATIDYDAALRKATNSQKEMTDANKKAAAAAQAMVQHFRTLWDSVEFGGASLTRVGTIIKGDFDNALKRAAETAEFMEKHFRTLWDSVEFGGSGLAHLGQSFGKLDLDIKKSLTWVDSLSGLERLLTGIQTDFAHMAVVAVRAIQQIDAVWKNTEMSKGQKFSSILTTGLAAGASIAGNTRTGGTLAGAASGAAVGSMFGPWGTAIGAGVGAIAGFFTSGKAKRELDAMKQGLIDNAGGWHALNSAAQKAGTTIEHVLNARTVKEYEAAVRDLNDAIAFQDQAMATLRETAEKYGFTLQELGPKFAAAELDEKAQELFKDFKVLTAAGIDVDTVIGKMSGSINDFVQNAVSMGIAVPSAMKPMIEKMIQLGLLTDKNGKIIGSLEESGVDFAMSMSEGFAALIDEVKKLTDAIARGLGLALDNAAGSAANLANAIGGIGGQYSAPDIQMPELQGFAAGTKGRYLDFGQGTPVMLHGRERVMTEGEGGGGVTVNVYGSVTTERDLIDAIRQGLNDSAGKRMRAA
jgi:hypothetical protein